MDMTGYTEREAGAALKAAIEECDRWVQALEELGFKTHPGLSPKENLALFGDWWAKRKADGN